MILKQFYLPCLAHASYVIGDEQSGTAAVVDPQRDTGQYVDFAAEHGLQIKHVFLTHLHADFIAGHLELRDRVARPSILAPQRKRDMHLLPFVTEMLLNSDAHACRRWKRRAILPSPSPSLSTT